MASTDDPVGLALASIVVGAAEGGSLITAGVLALRFLQSGRGGGAQPNLEFAVVSAAVVIGAVAAGLVGFILTKPIDDLWRRGVTGALATMAALMLGAASAPVDMIAGIVGLGVYFLILASAAAVGIVRIHRTGEA